jgi:hypothetical protein
MELISDARCEKCCMPDDTKRVTLVKRCALSMVRACAVCQASAIQSPYVQLPNTLIIRIERLAFAEHSSHVVKCDTHVAFDAQLNMHQHYAFTNHNTSTADTMIVDRMRHTYAYVTCLRVRAHLLQCACGERSHGRRVRRSLCDISPCAGRLTPMDLLQ